MSIRKIIKYKYSILLMILVFLFLSIYVAVVFSIERNQLSGNAASLVAMAVAPFQELGSPYKDYWEFASPGVMLLIGLWVRMFGSTIFSFKVLQLLFLLELSAYSTQLPLK